MLRRRIRAAVCCASYHAPSRASVLPSSAPSSPSPPSTFDPVSPMTRPLGLIHDFPRRYLNRVKDRRGDAVRIDATAPQKVVHVPAKGCVLRLGQGRGGTHGGVFRVRGAKLSYLRAALAPLPRPPAACTDASTRRARRVFL